ncbi:MAG: DNA cytosine methyltransferase, partial [Defluviitaleaceae bacterium]|nr:DNA cytosine methyltransferase [Defluviitaleaceae bacterium]
DINQINGADNPPVDIITGGFPCQNLSHAGLRAGLHGDRSSLFFQMSRIIREMRKATNNMSPRFIVVENVPGMYSSNKGQDFREVLNELVQIKDETISIPMPKNGKWLGAGEIVGRGFSLAWRTLCASGWGTAQRRRRCYLVIDLAGECAGQILFDESRLHGDSTPCNQPGEGTTGDSADCIGIPSGNRALAFEPGAAARLGGHAWEEIACTLRADMGDNQLSVVYDARGNGDGLIANTITGDHENRVTDYTKLAVMPFGISSYNSNAMKSSNPHSGIYEAETSRTLDTSSPDPNKNAGGMMVVCLEGNGTRPSHKGSGFGVDVSFTLNTVERHAVCYDDAAYAMTTGSYAQVCKEQSPTLQARDYKDAPVVAKPEYVVRRLTPQECAMLQGLPYDWCNGLETLEPTDEDIIFWSEVWETHRKIMGKAKKPKTRNQIIKWLKNPYSDSAAYKLYGNGIAIPCGAFVLGGIAWVAKPL